MRQTRSPPLFSSSARNGRPMICRSCTSILTISKKCNPSISIEKRDVDFPGLFVLHNTGDEDDAIISSADTNFPSTTEQVRLFSFPVAEYIDVNNDLKKDLLVSSFEPGLETSRSTKSVWWYKNTGGDNAPFFLIEQKDFLQSEMIDRGSGAYPVLEDWDGDGLLDLFVGNYGFYQYSYYENFFLKSVYKSRIGFFKNIGSAQQPQFQPLDDDFAGLNELEKLGLIPTFEDLDMDGDQDLLSGYGDGKIILSINNEGEFETVTESYQDIDVGEFSAPQLFDLDRDGLTDLIIGEKGGNLNYYRNTGSSGDTVFEYVTDSLGKINVTDYDISWDGYSVPYFFRLNSGETQLLVGSEQGDIFYYTDIDGNLDGIWTESDKLEELLDTTGVSFDRGIRTAATIGIITKDDKPEMIVGNYSGGLEYFNGSAEVMPGYEDRTNMLQQLRIFPTPSRDYAEVYTGIRDASIELSIYSINGQLLLSQAIQSSTTGSFRVYTSSFENGVYIIRIIADSGLYQGKMVVQR